MTDKHVGGRRYVSVDSNDTLTLSYHTGHVIQNGTSPPQRYIDPATNGGVGRAKTREEDETEEELTKRNEREAAIARYNNPSSQFLFSFSLVVIYVKIFHGTAALSACTVPKTFAHDAGLLSPSRFDLFLSLSLSLVPLFQHVEKCRALRFARRR